MKKATMVKSWIPAILLIVGGCNLAPQRHMAAPSGLVDSPVNPYCMLSCKSTLTINIHEKREEPAPPAKGRR